MSRDRLGVWGPNAAVFVASACIMIIEIVAGHIVSQYLGQSLYTWTTIIGIVLAGIAVGNYIGGWMADRFSLERTLALMFVAASAGCLTVPVLNHLMGEWLFLAGYLLVAWLGSIAVVCVVAGVLALIAVIYGRRVATVYLWLTVWGSVACLAMSPFTMANEVGTRWRLRERLPENTVFFDESQYNRILIKDTESGERVMYLDKLLHSKMDPNDLTDLKYTR